MKADTSCFQANAFSALILVRVEYADSLFDTEFELGYVVFIRGRSAE